MNGRDIFAEAVQRAYAAAGMSISWVDDFVLYHLGGGEIHCGTNTLRDTSRPWW